MKNLFAILLGALLLTGFAVGCATTNNDESDIPWNAPESWEGSPYIPGFGDQ